MCLYVSLTAGSAAHRWPEAEKKRGDSFFFFFFLADCVHWAYGILSYCSLALLHLGVHVNVLN